MEETVNLQLKKPEAEDFYNIEDFNDNMDKLDLGIKGIQDNKVDRVQGKILSTNDYTNEEKQKLANLSGNGSYVGSIAPSDTKLLWVDTGNSGVMKFYNGTVWVPIKAVWG